MSVTARECTSWSPSDGPRLRVDVSRNAPSEDPEHIRQQAPPSTAAILASVPSPAERLQLRSLGRGPIVSPLGNPSLNVALSPEKPRLASACVASIYSERLPASAQISNLAAQTRISPVSNPEKTT